MGSHRLAGSIAGIILGAVLAALGNLAPAVAEDDDHECEGHVSGVLQISYDGGTVAFDPGQSEFDQGQQEIIDHGHLHWKANTRHWLISMKRDAWDYSGQGGYPVSGGVEDIALEIKYGNGTDSWHPIAVAPATTTWINGNRKGRGVYDGVDWRIVDIGWDDVSPGGVPPAGSYSCTVTFTIEHSS